MKVRTKIALLLLTVVGVFVAGLVGIKMHDQRKFVEILGEYDQARQKSFDAFIQRWTQSIEVLANDYSCWDAMVAAIAQGDRKWAEENLGDAALAMPRANAIWVYTRDRQLFYSHNNLYSDALIDVPLPREQIGMLLDEKKLCHFFAVSPLGLFEIRGATIHPSRDSARVTPQQGYLFVGHFWSHEDLKDVSLLTGHNVDIVPASESGRKSGDERIGVVTFSRQLPGWNGDPLAKFVVRNDSLVLSQLHGSSETEFLWLILFALIIFLLLVFCLTRWVNLPIRALSTCLRTRSLQPIQWLLDDPCEFGDFARMLREFFKQRDDLIREMTERHGAQKALHESEERLRHSQKMEAVGRLAGGIAHDFNNLLTGIIGYAELIGNRTKPEDASHDDAAQIARAGEQAASLTRQLLAFSRKQILQPRVIDLNTLILETKKLLQRVIGEHIDLRVETAAAMARVRADPHQIEQVVLNLGVNARDAMPGGGVLTIRTGNVEAEQTITDGTFSLPPGKYVTLTVKDSGCGMDAETRERIFEPFFTTKGPGKGTGLGLATVYGIVQQSGGGISLSSTEGAGTAFTVYLPQESAPLDVPRPEPSHVSGSQDSETVLVVEDDETVRELVCAVLAEQGYEVLCAARGSEALRMAREHPGKIDLMLSDIIMPQMHGPQLARELQSIRPNTKVLFVSGYSDSDISDQGILAPDVRFLEKPFTPETLGRKVREVLDENGVAHPA